ncbi:MAG: hypothetical protein WC372_08955 [Candidatus Neomarinimicrobiota bacterium]|jgi:hypothetical protein
MAEKMRAILDGDRIVKLCIEGGVEIGKPPKGVGLERLRWDGKKLVDLATLTNLWVTIGKGGVPQLHASKLPGAIKVDASYKDRRKIRVENGLLTTTAPIKVVDKERLIHEKIREMAIRELIEEGKLVAEK